MRKELAQTSGGGALVASCGPLRNNLCSVPGCGSAARIVSTRPRTLLLRPVSVRFSSSESDVAPQSEPVTPSPEAPPALPCGGARQDEVKPHGKLLTYLQDLTEAEQEDVFAKLAARGYAEPGREELVETLTDDMLKKMGIGPMALRSTLLQAFTVQPKTVTVCDDDGNQKKVTLLTRCTFERWAADNNLTEQRHDGTVVPIEDWSRVRDGATYQSGHRLGKRVDELQAYQDKQSRALEDEVAERALKEMRLDHKEAERLVCGTRHVLHRQGGRGAMQVDEAIVANECCRIVEAKQTVDGGAVEQLSSLMEFIREGAEAGDPDFFFAKRRDGTVKQLQGVLGGLRLVAPGGDKVKQEVAKRQWRLYLPDGGRIRDNSRHTVA